MKRSKGDFDISNNLAFAGQTFFLLPDSQDAFLAIVEVSAGKDHARALPFTANRAHDVVFVEVFHHGFVVVF